MDAITFIIPSIGRDSLKNTIRSLLNQTSDNWKAIIIFDGCKNTLDKNDYNEKCTFYEIDKTKCVINQASDVRNYGIKYANTKWVGFLDDDDTISRDYVEYFLNQYTIFNFDLFIYRMINKDLTILPSLLSKDIIPCDIGISFIVKRTIFDSIQFKNSHCEDYDFLNLVKKNKNLILINNTIKYFVKSNEEDYLEEQLEYGDYYKIFINGTNPFIYLHYFHKLL
mgnify:CR=1 FL=1